LLETNSILLIGQFVIISAPYMVIINLVTFLFSGKILIIGGGIANFTNVAATFKVNIKFMK